MKEYKYKINGNLYKVSVGEIEKNIAHVEVKVLFIMSRWKKLHL